MSQLILEMHVSREARERFGLDAALFSLRGTALFADLKRAQRAAARINAERDAARFPELAVTAGELHAAGLLHELMHLLIGRYSEEAGEDVMAGAMRAASAALGERVAPALTAFTEAFPPTAVYRGEQTAAEYLAGQSGGLEHSRIMLEELLLLSLTNTNPALERFRVLFDDRELDAATPYKAVVNVLETELARTPRLADMTLLDALRAPALSHPTSLQGQLEHLRRIWEPVLGERVHAIFTQILLSADVMKEERKSAPWGGPGPAHVMTFTDAQAEAVGPAGTGTVWGPERTKRQPVAYERFSPDSSWMPRVVMLAKSTFVWLEQLSRRYQRHIQRLDQIPDEELDEIAGRGFTALWLIGLWERSEASKRIKNLRGNPDAVASAYALYDYVIARDLGGEDAFQNLRDRAGQRGVRLASDMVPNHVGIDGKWVIEKPDYFLQLPEPPYPGYTFSGPDLSSDERVGIFLEDHYWDSSDAAVVFKRLDRYTGEARYLYHGNDGTTFPWNDTAQLDYLNPAAREAVMQTILHVARKFPVIRFDAAMTLAKQHIQRLWYPEPGEGGAIPSRAQYGAMPHEVFEKLLPHEFWREVVDRVAQEVPDTLLLAEAFWMMEPYFVRTLGMHRVYNSAFMHMFKNEENAKYRLSIKNTLEFDPEILKRFVNFMNNPDEETAVAQFGRGDKYFGVCAVMCTLPGLPMFGHGQFEGFAEKYGMEYQKPKWDERPDPHLLERHAREIVPLLHRRAEFAEVEHFALFDCYTGAGTVDENVFAYSNRHGDKASLVVYNNAYERTSGWLKRSAAFRHKQSGELRQVDLAAALGLSGEDGRYLRLRDHAEDREYLLPCRDLWERGLHVALDGYQYRVYTDLEELVDRDGQLAWLHQALNGRGVRSVEEALHDRRHQPLYAALGALLDALADDRVDDRLEATNSVPDAATRFLGECRVLGALPDADAAERMREDARALRAALRDLRAAAPEAPKGADDAQAGPGEPDPAESDPADTDPDATSRDPRATEADSAPSTAEAAPLEPDALPLLPTLERGARAWTAWAVVRALGTPAEAVSTLRLEPYFQRELGQPQAALLQVLTALPGDAALWAVLERDDVQDFLRVNEHAGTRWFDQDMYRWLAAGLAVRGGLEGTGRAPESLRAALARFGRLERSSGYRLDALRSEATRLEGGLESADPLKPDEALPQLTPLKPGGQPTDGQLTEEPSTDAREPDSPTDLPKPDR